MRALALSHAPGDQLLLLLSSLLLLLFQLGTSLPSLSLTAPPPPPPPPPGPRLTTHIRKLGEHQGEETGCLVYIYCTASPPELWSRGC